MKSLVFLTVASAMMGCQSATRQIAQETGEIRASATFIREHVAAGRDQLAQPSPDLTVVDNLLLNIDNLATDIVDRTNKVQTTLIPKVEDKVPYWATLLQRWGLVAIGIVAIIFLWQTGLGVLIKRIVWSLGWFIPSGTKGEAKLDHEALAAPSVPSELKESVAAKRAARPDYDAAFRKLKKE